MVDSVQIILIFVIVVLTILLLVLGVQVYFILKDLRKTVEKANRVLDNAEEITENVNGPIASLSSLTSTFQTGSFVTVAKVIKSFLGKDRDEEHRKRSRRD